MEENLNVVDAEVVEKEVASPLASKRIGDGQIVSKLSPLAKNPRSKSADKALIARRAKRKAAKHVHQKERKAMTK